MDSKFSLIADYLYIVTENNVGDLCSISCKYIQDLIDDWEGDCVLCPANDAKVFFASWNNKPFNPYEYTDFESLMSLLKSMVN